MTENKFESFTIEELQAEIDKRNGVTWPKYATIFIDYPWDDINVDDIAEQLEWSDYNDDVIHDKLMALNLPGFEIIISVDCDSKTKIVAINGMKISDQPFDASE